MAICTIDEGFNLSCLQNAGGVVKFYIGEWQDQNFALDANGVTVTGTDAATPTTLYKFEQTIGTAQFLEEGQFNAQNGTNGFTQNVSLVFNKMDETTTKLMDSLTTTKSIAVVEDKNGEFFLVGMESGLFPSAGNGDTGVALADRNGYTLTLTAEEKLAARIIDPTALGTIFDLQ